MNAAPGTDSDTPRSWRVAAGAVLIGGFVVGLAATNRRFRRVVPLATAGVALGAAIPVALGSRRPPIAPEDAAGALAEAVASGKAPTFSIVVGARDEAAVLAQLVGDVAEQDYRTPDGKPRFELIVVDDRSTDGSGEAVKKAAEKHGIGGATRVIRRDGENLPDGKGAALTAAQPDVCNGDVVLVLDADARLETRFLSLAAGYFAAGARAVTARRRILDSESGWLAQAQADEQTLDGELNRGRWAMGGCSEFRGNGIMVRRDLLAAAGGWRASALTEDTDLSSRIAAIAGERVAWAIDVEVWEEPVRSMDRLWRQRLRWAEGALRRAFEHGPAVVGSDRLSVWARVDFGIYAGQLAVPAVVLGAVAGAVVTHRKKSLLWVLIGYLGASAILGWDSLRWERDRDGRPIGTGERLARTARLSVFNGIWLGAVPRALATIAFRGGRIRYEKMEHGDRSR